MEQREPFGRRYELICENNYIYMYIYIFFFFSLAQLSGLEEALEYFEIEEKFANQATKLGIL